MTKDGQEGLAWGKLRDFQGAYFYMVMDFWGTIFFCEIKIWINIQTREKHGTNKHRMKPYII